MDWKNERGKQIEEYILFFHLCALVVMALALLSALKLSFTPTTAYTNYPIAGIILVVFGLISIIYFFRDRLNTLTSGSPPNTTAIIICFTILAVTIAIIFISQLNGENFTALYFIPVLYTSVNYGRKLGLIFFCLCAASIFAVDWLHGSSGELHGTVEADILLTLIMFMAAWLIGGLIDIERDTIKKLAELADRDDLTGLWNKRYLYRKLRELFNKAQKENVSFSLVFADIDFFKTYNDALGHLHGDEVLKQIGRIIDAAIPAEGIAVRYGGEEFAIILYGYDSQQALAVAEAIRKEVENYPFYGKEYQPSKKITVSLGVATYPDHASIPIELLRRADDALFRAKSVRRNKTEVYSSVFDELSISFNNMGHDLLHSLKTLLGVIQAKDRYTRGHSERVTEYAMVVAEHLGLAEEDRQTIRLSAFLHDIGKIEIEREVLNKPLSLNEEECKIIRQHPIWGAEIVSSIELLNNCVPIILAHHENYDGSGYPYGLKGDEIPLGARILRVVDSFDAMVTNRPYRQGLSFDESLEEIRRGAGSIYDPEIVSTFLSATERISQLLAG